MHLIVNLILCGILLCAAVGVSIYRNWLEDHCDHYIHLHNDSHDAAAINEQTAICRRLESMDKLKTGLIAAVIVYVVVIIGLASYNAWISSGM